MSNVTQQAINSFLHISATADICENCASNIVAQNCYPYKLLWQQTFRKGGTGFTINVACVRTEMKFNQHNCSIPRQEGPKVKLGSMEWLMKAAPSLECQAVAD